MEDNWIIDESKKADKSKGYIILENPETKSYLDDLLINRFWPVIRLKLNETNYIFSPQEKPKTEFKLSYTFHNGSGAGWGISTDQEIDDRISKLIDVNTQLYEFSKEGYISKEMIGKFLTLAYKIYEA